MKIGIDVSQTAYDGGVGNYLVSFVKNLIAIDNKNEYVLFYSSLRQPFPHKKFSFLSGKTNVVIKTFRYPPSVLNILWNKLHTFPIEALLGELDMFITSDWTEPPVKRAKKATIIYDLIVYKSPEETDKKIISTQKAKLKWVKKESEVVFCISEATKKDAQEILGLSENKLRVLYPSL